jgi:sRNA-binding regulator protein Hfq
MADHEIDTQANVAARRQEDDAQTTWLRAAAGRIVRVHFLEGRTLVGQLLAFDQDTLVIQGSGPTPLLVFKQSIAYVAVDEHGATA